MTRSPVIILAGGKGTRLASLKLGVPKPLAPIGGVPFIFFLLRHLRKCGFRSVLIAISQASQEIQTVVKTGRSWGMRVRYFRIPERPYGTGSTVLLARPYLTNRFYIVNGDTYISFNPKELEAPHRQHQAGVTLALVRKSNVSRYGSLRLAQDQRVEQFVEKRQKGPGMVSAGVLLVQQSALMPFSKKVNYSLEHDVLPRLVRAGSVYGHRVAGGFWDIGTPSSYRAFTRLAPTLL